MDCYLLASRPTAVDKSASFSRKFLVKTNILLKLNYQTQLKNFCSQNGFLAVYVTKLYEKYQ